MFQSIRSFFGRLATKLDFTPWIIDNWRQLFRYHSVQISLVGILYTLPVAIEAAAAARTFRSMISESLTWGLVLVAFVGTILGRAIKQKKIEPPNAPVVKDADNDDDGEYPRGR